MTDYIISSPSNTSLSGVLRDAKLSFSLENRTFFRGNGYFAGKILDSNNHPQEGATVQIWHRATNSLVGTTVTDDNGDYTFVNVPVGEMFDLIAIDPTGKWERKVSSSRYPQSGWYPDLTMTTRGRYLYDLGEKVNQDARGFGGNGSYAYTIDNSTEGLICDGSSGHITSDPLSVSGEIIEYNVTVGDGSGKTLSKPMSFKTYDDPYHSSVVSLMHFDGLYSPTVFTDELNNSWVRGGTPVISNASPIFGVGSYYSSSTSANRITWTCGSAPVLGDGDFTLECWFIPKVLTSASQWLGIVNRRVSNTNASWSLYQDQNNAGINFGITFTGQVTDLTYSKWTTPLVLNTIYHLAVCRVDNIITLYVNGEAGNTIDVGTSAEYKSTNSIVLGALDTSGGASSINGYIDEMRITQGVARYTSNFTPPTAPFTLN